MAQHSLRQAMIDEDMEEMLDTYLELYRDQLLAQYQLMLRYPGQFSYSSFATQEKVHHDILQTIMKAFVMLSEQCARMERPSPPRPTVQHRPPPTIPKSSSISRVQKALVNKHKRTSEWVQAQVSLKRRR
jgi:hypothetical protein